jgi:ribonuclease P/MRP protein subunit RPP40
MSVTDPTTCKVECEKKHLEDVWIPNPSSVPPKPNHGRRDELEDWENDMSTLYEWIGLAGLHAER